MDPVKIMGHAPNREETETRTQTEADTQGPHAQMEKCKLKQPEETMEQRQSTETCRLLSAKTHDCRCGKTTTTTTTE